MSADYGGTEIRSALDCVFKYRNKYCPTAVFVLTDGEVSDNLGILESAGLLIVIERLMTSILPSERSLTQFPNPKLIPPSVCLCSG